MNEESAKPFSLQEASLLANISIEASAGTGKTYTLEQIICHLLENYELSIKQILLLTYTEKAANELRERIRSKLGQRFAELKGKEGQRILRALSQFNEANISTIHSFFQRCLELYSLEVGRPLEAKDNAPIDPNANPITELLLDELQSYDEQLKKSLIGAGELLALKKSGELDTQKILDYCGNPALQNFWNMHPGFVLSPGEKELQAFQMLEQEFTRGEGPVFSAFCQLIQAEWHKDIFHNTSTKKKLKNLPPRYKPAMALSFFEQLKSTSNFSALLKLLQTRPSSDKEPYLAVLQSLHPQKLEEQNPKFATDISEWPHYSKALEIQNFLEAFPPYLQLTHNLKLIPATYLAQFLLSMRDRIYPKLQTMKSLHGTRSFNDMVEDLYQVLVLKKSGDPQTLLALLQKQYRSILVDEFQDTDPVQWQMIFEIFGKGKILSSSDPQKLVRSHNFIIVGDPKQSIYGFRGVSRQLYQQVQKICDFHYRLGANYRSNASLVGACNTIFQQVWPKLFQPVSPANNSLEEASFIFLDCDSPSEASHTELRQKGIETIAQKICLLSDGSRKLSDIAVLVRQSNVGQAMQKRLAELGIEAQYRQKLSLFSDPNAQALQYFLLALCHPRNLNYSMHLLLSSFFELQVPEAKFLLELDVNTGPFAQVWIEDLLRWRQQVDKGHIQGPLEELFQYGNKIYDHLQKLEGGKRYANLQQDLFCRILAKSERQTYNNLRHLIEILSSEQLAQGLDCLGLCKFIIRQGDDYVQSSNLEDHAVQIMTIHMSKGLEFPIVFLHMGLDTMKDTELYVQNEFQQEAQIPYRQTGHLALEDKTLFWRESCAELRRLLYVALTRASHKVYFPFHNSCPQKVPYRAILEEMLGFDLDRGEDALFSKDHVSSEELRSELEELPPEFFSIESSQKTRRIEPVPPEHVEISYRKLREDNLQQRFSVVTSFSSLQHSIEGARKPDNLEALDKERDRTTARDVIMPEQEWHELCLSPGAELGNLLHKLLETCDYQWIHGLSLEQLLDSQTWYEEVSLQSRSYFPRNWIKRAYPAVCRMIWHTLHRNLSSNLRLCELGTEQRRHEVEFLLHIPRDSTLEQGLLEVLGRVEVSRGFLKGFIDLLFVHEGQIFLLDWKSNIQSNPKFAEPYAADALQELMQEHLYTMQYLIYLSVIYYYLKKLYGPEFTYKQHFGGCYYLFLRGSSLGDEHSGIFFHKPEEARITTILRQLGLD